MAVKAQCYTTLVRPIMEYACIIWEPVTQKNIRELEMVQRRAAHFVTGDYRTTSSVTRMLEALQWTELQQRRKRAKVIMLYRIVNHLVAISPEPYLIPRGVALTTRGHDTRFEDTKSPTIIFSISNPSMERITNCCRNCLHIGRIQRQPPDSCHILDMPV